MDVHYCLPRILPDVYTDVEARNLMIDSDHFGFHFIQQFMNGV